MLWELKVIIDIKYLMYIMFDNIVFLEMVIVNGISSVLEFVSSGIKNYIIFKCKESVYFIISLIFKYR